MALRSIPTIGLALAAAAQLTTAEPAAACPLPAKAEPSSALSVAAPPDVVGSPILIDGRVVAPRFEDGVWVPAELRLRLAPPLATRRYLVEHVGGDAPLALQTAWSAAEAESDGTLRLPLAPDVPVPPFGTAVRVRAEAPGGQASNVIWVVSPAGDGAPRGDQSERVLFFILAGVLGMLAAIYQRTAAPESRARLAAVAALSGAVVLLATSGMPWLHSAIAGVECRLGEENLCALPPVGELDPIRGSLALFELERWRATADAVRLGQLLGFSLLLPALIWLMVEPRSRPAQASAAVGATIAAFAFLAVALYGTTAPPWLAVQLYVTFDLALLAAAAVVAGVIAVVRQSLSLEDPCSPTVAALRRPSR